MVSYLVSCLQEKRKRTMKRESNKYRISGGLFSVALNDDSRINTGSLSIFKNLFTVYPNDFNSRRNFVRLRNRCLVAYIACVEKNKIGVISLLDQPSQLHSHVFC